MSFRTSVLLFLTLQTALVLSQTEVDCDVNCKPAHCDRPRDCKAGIVLDVCHCCYVCGKRDGDRCDNDEINFQGFGKCGEHLECLVRRDLEWDDPPEALCYCKDRSPVCGTDNVTYDNICQLTEARYTRRDGLRAMSNGSCFREAHIRSPPQDIANVRGTSAVLSCEATGWPIPKIRWAIEGPEGKYFLPADHPRLVERSHTGHIELATTSWLYFLNLTEEDTGTYYCRASNDLGVDFGNATVSIIT